MANQQSNKELVKAGHAFAAAMDMDTPIIKIAKLVTELADRLDVMDACNKAMAVESTVARKAVQVFCDVVGANTDAICEEVGSDGVRAILAAMSATGNMPATDTILNAVRAEGIHFAVNHMLAAWQSGFINDTPEQAYDITGGFLTALEFLPNASPQEFTADYHGEVRSAIAKSRNNDAAKDGE